MEKEIVLFLKSNWENSKIDNLKKYIQNLTGTYSIQDHEVYEFLLECAFKYLDKNILRSMFEKLGQAHKIRIYNDAIEDDIITQKTLINLLASYLIAYVTKNNLKTK